LAIGSTLRRHWLEIAWGAFAIVNVLAMLRLTDWETIPFHFVWVSLTLLYGLRIWTLRATWGTLVGVFLITGGAMASTIMRSNGERPDELTEVPLMAAMFVAMVWHARRYQAATERANELAESEHRLRERERDFVRDASHALRTPITVARGHAELIQAARIDPQVHTDAGVVLDELERLSRMSERLLILAAADHVGFLHRVATDPRALVRETIVRWTPAARRRWRMSVRTDGTVPLDVERISIALDALLENAIRYTGPGDLIEVSAHPSGGTVILGVADSGRGVEPELRSRVFDRFATEDTSAERRAGTGLGLAIVKAIVDAHEGEVSVTDTPGGGATFQMWLPGYVASRERRPDVAVVGDLDPAEEPEEPAYPVILPASEAGRIELPGPGL
jgi:signal transduction histidine kinase